MFCEISILKIKDIFKEKNYYFYAQILIIITSEIIIFKEKFMNKNCYKDFILKHKTILDKQYIVF